ncbi:MAG: heat-inducible transcription repressor HrcA [Nitrospinaceae bacterium]|nr:heat-inducible transcription repressor HrcA [Nitrospinaceae bacterium]NIR53798.1 heat-inducible transcription repressor HrcA [Nitrospinaceae bacterium]NIS84208.1 heat-inducible transcription repressor HrcA [Nitrospinaceae bacterium]NIT81014.1 heat-inducible transcription repressor HrcA [Nitrospinaceae bacterium]NIU43304.1 heat-inducible transcription repressor HrcA [Nitrospinaceae bacterium]
MKQVILDERSRAILLETINDFVSTAEPVGSRTISKKLSRRLSPATIRNVMADLEDLGYLYQPHTSAGRVPTDRGYRYFVNQILDARNPQPVEPVVRDPQPYRSQETLEEVLGSACSLLSQNSHQTGLVMIPGFWNLSLKHIEFMSLENKRVLAVFISERGMVKKKVVRLKKEIPRETLAALTAYLNSEFAGQSLNAIREELCRRMQTEKEHHDQLMKKANELWSGMAADEEEEGDLLVEGVVHMLDQPEFAADLETMKKLMQTVEKKDKLIKLLDLCMQQSGLSIIIGEENAEEEMRAGSLIAQSYRLDDKSIGTLAVFGPKRMDYEKIIGIVNSTANNVSEFLSSRKYKGA